MNIVVENILVYGLFLILISINYYIFIFINSKLVVKDKVTIMPNIIEGFLNGMIAVMIKCILLFIFNIEYYYLIIILSILIIIRNFVVYIGAIIPPIIMYWFLYDFGDYSYVLIIFLITIFFFLVILFSKIFNKKIYWEIIYIPINLFSLLIMLIISWLLLNINISWHFLLLFLIPILFLTIIFYLYRYILSFWISANSLIDINIYDFNNFYRIKTSRNAFGTFLFKNRIESGVFILFSLENNDDKETQLILIENQFNKFNSLYFRISNNEYGIFFSFIDYPNLEKSIVGNNFKIRERNDALSEAEQNINIINQISHRKIKCGAVFYGVQEQDFYQAFDKARFALNSSKITSKNIITLFNPSYHNKYLFDSLLMKKLNKEIYTGYISTEFQNGIGLKSIASNLFYSKPYIPTRSIDLSIEQILLYLKERGDEAVLTRYLAAETIRNFGNSKPSKNKKIMFAYSASIISSKNFNINIFSNIIKYNNINPYNVILMLNYKTIKKFWRPSFLRKNLDKMRKIGIKIAINNLYNIDEIESIIPIISPNYFCLNNNFYSSKNVASNFKKIVSISKKRKIKIIASDISNKKQLKNIIINNIDIFFGDLIQHGCASPMNINSSEKRKIKEMIYG